MKNQQLVLLTILLACCHTNIAAMSTTDSSSLRGPSSVATKVQCTTFSMNGRNIGYYTALSQTQYNTISNAFAILGFPMMNPWGFANLASVYDPADCKTVTTTNTGMTANTTFVVLTGGGDIGIMCPSDYPYYQSYNETWGSALGNGTIVPSAQCCKVPPNRVANTTSWTTYTPDSTLGTDGVCNDYTYP